jgi:hypothetical protein
MSCLINPDEVNQSLLVACAGDLPLRDLAAARREADGLLAQKQWRRVKVDITSLRTVPAARDLFDFARGLSSAWPPALKVAVVVRRDQVRQVRLIQAVVKNAGGHLAYFSHADRATTWLAAPVH